MEIIPTVKCEVDLNKVLDIRSFNVEKILEMDPGFLQAKYPLLQRAHLVPAITVTFWDRTRLAG